MTTWSPVTGLPIQYSEDASGTAASGNYLKFYASGTTTPINMATDSTGGTTLSKCQLNSLGQAINGSSAVFIPHIDQKYKAVLYPDSTTADANTFASAIWNVDGIEPPASNTLANKLVREFDTMAAAIAATDISVDTVLLIKDRANSLWDVVLSSGVTENTYNIVQCTGVGTLSLVLRIESEVILDTFWEINNTDDQAHVFVHAISLLSSLGLTRLILPPREILLESLNANANPFKCFASLSGSIEMIGVPGKTILKAADGLSVSNQWNFFVLSATTAISHVRFYGITFDFNGVNNLTPNTAPYRPCLALWIMASGAGSLDNVEVENCTFKDNPGSNSVSIIDDAPSGGLNSVKRVLIHKNKFENFGYAVGNNANVHQDDHSCIYIAAAESIITENWFYQDYTVPEAVSIGMAAIDYHCHTSQIHGNICYNVHTLVAHQTNLHNAKDLDISGNILTKVNRIYAFFSGGTGNGCENINISGNVLSYHSSVQELPIIDLYNANSTETPYNIVIKNNVFSLHSGTTAGRVTPAIKVRRGDNLEISENHCWNINGPFLHYAPNAAMYNLIVKNNIIGNYGLGEVAGYKRAIVLDTSGDGGGGTTKAYITGNLITNGSLTTREAGIRYNGAYQHLEIDDNIIVGATSKVTTPSHGATTSYVRRGKLLSSQSLNFAAPGAVPGVVAQSVTVTGARVGDTAEVAFSGAMPSNFILTANVTATDTVTVRWTQLSGGATDPDGAGGYYVITINQLQTD